MGNISVEAKNTCKYLYIDKAKKKRDHLCDQDKWKHFCLRNKWKHYCLTSGFVSGIHVVYILSKQNFLFYFEVGITKGKINKTEKTLVSEFSPQCKVQ